MVINVKIEVLLNLRRGQDSSPRLDQLYDPLLPTLPPSQLRRGGLALKYLQAYGVIFER